MRSFFDVLLSPIILFWLLIGIFIFSRILRKERLSQVSLILGLVWLFVISVTPFSQWMVFRLENQYSSFKPETHKLNPPVHILIFGGGHTIAPDLPAGSQLTTSALARLAEAIRIYREVPGSKLICSGYSSSKRTTQAEMLANAAIDLGVDSLDIVQNRLPQNTMEEVDNYKDRFGNKNTLIVVTSGYHMPRVMLLCERAGLRALPAPTDFYMKEDPARSKFDFYPYAVKISMFEIALHEYAGMLKVKWSD